MIVSNVEAGPGLNVVSNNQFGQYIPTSGTLLYNSDTKKFTVTDGKQFSEITPTNIFISLSAENQEILMWAKQQMEIQKIISQKIESSLAVKEAYEHFQTILALSK